MKIKSPGLGFRHELQLLAPSHPRVAFLVPADDTENCDHKPASTGTFG